MNDLVKFGGNMPANPGDLLKGLENISQNVQVSGGLPFLRLLKSGHYAYGPEKIEPEQGSEWAVNPYSLMHGFDCWEDGEMLGDVLVPFNASLPVKAELQDFGAEWKQKISMNLQCLTGEDTGLTVSYGGTAVGLLNAAKDIINALISQLQNDARNFVPVVTLEADSYDHKKYGEIFFPVIEITRWISIDGVATDAEEEPDALEEPEAKPKSEAKGDEKVASGTRRRRQRSDAKEPAKEEKPSRRRRPRSKSA